MNGAFLALDGSIFGEDFGVRPFRFRHRLAGHPFLSLERVLEVLPGLPENRVECSAGDTPVTARSGENPRAGLTVDEALRRIKDERMSMVLENVEDDPGLGWLVQQVLDEVGALSEDVEPGMRAREGFVLLGSPGAVAPFRVDPEHNFLLQVRGTRSLHVFVPGVLSARELERVYTGGRRNVAFREELQPRAHTFVLGPGDGLYIPVTHPHWAKNGPEPSISFSATFRTAAADARERLHKMNAALRSFGLPTPAPGRVPALDRAKLLAFDAARAAKRLFSNEPMFDAV